MRFFDYLMSVRHTLSSNRLRAALTLLGTVIGAASIVLLAGMLRSGEEMLISSSQSAAEADLIRVSRQEVPNDQSAKELRELTRNDQSLVDGSALFPGVATAAESKTMTLAEPVGQGQRDPNAPKDFRVTLVSAGLQTVSLYRLGIARGRGITEQDLHDRTRVCVVGYSVWEKLFGHDTALTNQRLRLEGHECAIVGVLASKPAMFGEDGPWMWNRKVLMPETTYDSMMQPAHAVQTVFVRLSAVAALAHRMPAMEDLLRSALLRQHGAHNFQVKSQNSSEGQEQLILSIIKGLLFTTALLSLFVGGINIMNIMLVTVTERTREIGVRRALGAPPSSIWMQFLLEAVFIAGVGGLIGVGSGIALTWLGAKAISSGGSSFAFHIETWSVALGLLLSMSTGVVFGLLPAVQASRLDPVEALRFE
jgi:putative ABC transport system permease protein